MRFSSLREMFLNYLGGLCYVSVKHGMFRAKHVKVFWKIERFSKKMLRDWPQDHIAIFFLSKT